MIIRPGPPHAQAVYCRPLSVHFRVALVVGLLLGVLTGAVSFARFDVVERGEAWFYDTWVRDAAKDIKTADDIVIVEISDRDIELVDENIGETWPWPRELQGELVRYISDSGAKAVLIDLIYQDRSAIEDDLETFAEVLKNSRTAVGVFTPAYAAALKKRPAESSWVSTLGTRASWAEAMRDAVTLMSYGQRVFVTEEAPGKLQLFSGGSRSAEEMTAEFERLKAEPSLAPLFADKPPVPRRVADLAKNEITGEEIVLRRFGMRVPGIHRLAGSELLAPTERIAESAPALGSVTQFPDSDGVLRRYLYMMRHRDTGLPSLSLATYLITHPEARVSIEEDAVRVGDMRIPTTPEGSTLLRFGSTRRFPRVFAYDVLASVAEISEGKPPRHPAQTFRGKYVLIIPTAAVLRDTKPSPLTRTASGGEIQAEALANLLSGRFITRAPAGLEAILACLFVTLVAVVVMGVARRVRRAWWGALGAAIAGIGCIVAYYLIGSRIYQSHDTWLAVFAPGLGGVFAAVNGLVFSAMSERQDRRFVQDALGRYTSRELVNELMRHPEKLSLAFGERRTVSVYFSDIAGFTSISEGMEPERLVLLLNEYLTAMTDIVLEHHGIVDKYIGDAVMAFWGAPLDDRNHAYNAVAAALKMKRACDHLRADWQQRFGHVVMARAGVNSGFAVAGNMGSTHKYNYTLMGDMVNLASRLEGANKAYGSDIMISETTQKELEGRFLLRELDAIAVKGKNQPVRVYEVLCATEEQRAEDLEFVAQFQLALETYRARDFSAARTSFEQALERRPNDGPSQVFIERCEILSQTPPAGDWDSVWRMKEK